MAMVKLNGHITEINGIMGKSDIWRYDVCGQHVQAYPRHIHNYKKSIQSSGFSRSKNLWSSHKWTESELSRWWRYCESHPKKNKKGETYYLHPFLAFLSVNIKRHITGKELVILPPD